MSRIDLDPTTEAALVDAYRAGRETVDQMSARFGLSQNRVYRTLHEHGLVGTRPRPPKRFFPEHRQEMVTLYGQGLSRAEVARRFDCSEQTVRNILLKAGAKIRRCGSPEKVFSASQLAEMVQRWRGGEAQAAIAKRFGVSQQTVSGLMRRHAPGQRPTTRAARARHGMWKGGRTTHPGGYTKVRLEADDPMFCMVSSSGSYVMEHRLVMARALGRPLAEYETVHHISADRSDNRLENLQLRVGTHGKGAALRCATCGSHDIVAVPLAGAI
jgi:transposase